MSTATKLLKKGDNTHYVNSSDHMLRIIDEKGYTGIFVFGVGTAKMLNKAVIQCGDSNGDKITFLMNIEAVDLFVIQLHGAESIVDCPYFIEEDHPKISKLKFENVNAYKSFLWNLRKDLMAFRDEMREFK